MALDQVLGDRQSKSGTTAATGAVGLVEALEDPPPIDRRDPDPRGPPDDGGRLVTRQARRDGWTD